DAHFNSPTLPVFMDDLDVEVRAVNNRLTIDGAFTSGDGKGRLTGDGVIDEDWQVNVRLQGDNIPVVQAPEIDLVVQPDLNLKVQVGEIFLGGKLEVTRGLLELKPLPPSAVQVSPDVVFIDERDELLETDMPWLFRTNLTV